MRRNIRADRIYECCTQVSRLPSPRQRSKTEDWCHVKSSSNRGLAYGAVEELNESPRYCGLDLASPVVILDLQFELTIHIFAVKPLNGALDLNCPCRFTVAPMP
jgi:hypothetical protein